MANHKSAKKRARQSEQRYERNRAVRSRVRTFVKRFQAALAGGEGDAAQYLRDAEREIRKAASKGVIPTRRASRHVSRLSRSLNATPSAE